MKQVAITVQVHRTVQVAARVLTRGVLRSQDDAPKGLASGTWTRFDRPDRHAGLKDLRADLEQVFARARSWPELHARLMAKGYCLRESGGALSLHRHPDDTCLCPLKTLQIAPATLVMRFCRPYPASTATWDLRQPDSGARDGTNATLQADG